MSRYIKNYDSIFTPELQEFLLTKTIAVIGCGGNGGYILEYIARLGVKSLYFWDGDTFNESNLNRQLGCTEETIGLNKAETMLKRLQSINSTIEYNMRNWYFSEKNEDVIDLFNCDIIIMAADDSYSIGQTRDMIKLVIERGIPCIDEYLRGFGGEVSIITNADLTLWDYNTELWNSQSLMPKEELTLFGSQTAYRCALIAAEVVNQMVQYFNNNPNATINQKLEIDIYHHKYRLYDKYGEI